MTDYLVERLRDRRVCSLAQNSCRNDIACEQAADRIEELEAKLAKAVEALEKLDVGEGWAAQIARTTLAELTGGKDE